MHYVVCGAGIQTTYTPTQYSNYVAIYCAFFYIADSKRSHSFTRQALPQILEDEVGERKEEKSVQTRELEEDGTQTITVQLEECDENIDHLAREESGLSASDCSDRLSSGSVSPHSIDREQTMDIAKLETTSLDSGCNMSHS